MRASKEQCQKASDDLQSLKAIANGPGSLAHEQRLAFDRIAEFLNVAKRKLPSEAAYKRDSKRRATAKGR